MNSRQRFRDTMAYGRADRVPYFEEGIRREVLDTWKKQGMPADVPLSELFPTDQRLEIALTLEPRPKLPRWPTESSDLIPYKRSLDPDDPARLPADWPEIVRSWSVSDDAMMLRVHRGFFQTLGVSGWRRFTEVNYLMMDDPELVHEALKIQASFAAQLVQNVLSQVKIDAAIFSEPIGGNSGPLISPKMFEEFISISYEPILAVLRQHKVDTIIFRTYANARILVPVVLRWGLNCLWACEVNLEAMDYAPIRQELGPELRLIGGIDVDVLRQDKEAIRREVEEKVPPLLEAGGYVPLADGRIRPDVPYENYVYYRELLAEVCRG